MKANLEKTCFIENGVLITKSKFIKEVADVHTYGKSKIVIVGSPKENMFKVYPHKGETKSKTLAFAYEQLVKVFEENSCPFDDYNVMWTNKGIPIVYDLVSSNTYSFR